jgi:predicted RNase H-like nuclease
MTSFIGIDMAWKIDGNHSGVAVMVCDGDRVELTCVSKDLNTLDGIVDFVRRNATLDSVIAIDASLVVTNETGQRPCETLIGKTFGKYHASCHTSNLGRPYAGTGPRLLGELEKLGFRHDFDIHQAKLRSGKWVFEVYPHPAMVRLFGLDRIIPYKKGSVPEKRAGLQTLRGYLRMLANGSRGLVMSATLDGLLKQNLAQIRGQELKKYEDTLDSVFCAYLAWHCWRWGQERNNMFGTLEHGYIVVPTSVA